MSTIGGDFVMSTIGGEGEISKTIGGRWGDSVKYIRVGEDVLVLLSKSGGMVGGRFVTYNYVGEGFCEVQSEFCSSTIGGEGLSEGENSGILNVRVGSGGIGSNLILRHCLFY